MNPVNGLALGRIVIGVLSLASPALAARLFGLDPAGNPQLPYLSRLFGAREIALGAVTLAARDGAHRNLAIAGIAVDAADAATGVLSARNKEVGLFPSALLTTVATGAVIAGVAGLVGSRDRTGVRQG